MALVLEHRPGQRSPSVTIMTQQPSWSARHDGSDREGAMGAQDPAGRGAAGKDGISAYRILRDVAGEILTTSDLGRVLERCGQLVEDLLQADACSIALFDDAAGALIPLLTMAGGRSTPEALPPLDLGTGRMRAAIKQGRALIVAHNLVLDGTAPLPLSETQSALAAMLIPLPLGPDFPGILWFGRIHGDPFTPEDQELAEALAALIALGMRGTKAFIDLQNAICR
jgi:transcriptional regulator with GAF, ATPase, and Fis domain